MYAAYVKTFGGWLYKSGHLASNALDSYYLPEEKPMGRKNWLRKAEVAKVIGAVKPKSSPNAKPTTIEKAKQAAEDLKFILYCGFHAGLRRKEIAMAKVSWFDLDHGLIHAQNMPEEGYALKDEENRTIDMSDAFRAFLIDYLTLRPTHRRGLPGNRASKISSVLGPSVLRSIGDMELGSLRRMGQLTTIL
jgi:integrase